ncbi:MAG: preprotein translocase subunit YajC [Deltaproteobacteria bacterium]|nr:preprotein translocase subunit YajC [Deltaproteobacteria bacterium]
MFRPQQKQQQEQEKFLSGLQKGDDVVTTGGLIGKVFQVAGKVVTLEIAPNVKARVLVSQIAGPLKLEDEAKDSAKVQEEKK